MAVIDNAFDQVTLVAPVRPKRGVAAREAYARAAERLADALMDLDRPIAAADRPDATAETKIEPVSNTKPGRYRNMVKAAKQYIAAGDIFQVVPSQRFRFEVQRQPPFGALPLAAGGS